MKSVDSEDSVYILLLILGMVYNYNLLTSYIVSNACNLNAKFRFAINVNNFKLKKKMRSVLCFILVLLIDVCYDFIKVLEKDTLSLEEVWTMLVKVYIILILGFARRVTKTEATKGISKETLIIYKSHTSGSNPFYQNLLASEQLVLNGDKRLTSFIYHSVFFIISDILYFSHVVLTIEDCNGECELKLAFLIVKLSINSYIMYLYVKKSADFSVLEIKENERALRKLSKHNFNFKLNTEIDIIKKSEGVIRLTATQINEVKKAMDSRCFNTVMRKLSEGKENKSKSSDSSFDSEAHDEEEEEDFKSNLKLYSSLKFRRKNNLTSGGASQEDERSSIVKMLENCGYQSRKSANRMSKVKSKKSSFNKKFDDQNKCDFSPIPQFGSSRPDSPMRRSIEKPKKFKKKVQNVSINEEPSYSLVPYSRLTGSKRIYSAINDNNKVLPSTNANDLEDCIINSVILIVVIETETSTKVEHKKFIFEFYQLECKIFQSLVKLHESEILEYYKDTSFQLNYDSRDRTSENQLLSQHQSQNNLYAFRETLMNQDLITEPRKCFGRFTRGVSIFHNSLFQSVAESNPSSIISQCEAFSVPLIKEELFDKYNLPCLPPFSILKPHTMPIHVKQFDEFLKKVINQQQLSELPEVISFLKL